MRNNGTHGDHHHRHVIARSIVIPRLGVGQDGIGDLLRCQPVGEHLAREGLVVHRAELLSQSRMCDAIGKEHDRHTIFRRERLHGRARELRAANRSTRHGNNTEFAILAEKHRGVGIARDYNLARLHIDRYDVECRRNLSVPECKQEIVCGPGDRTIAHAVLDQANRLGREQQTERFRRFAASLPVDHHQTDAATRPLDELDRIATLATGILVRLGDREIDAKEFLVEYLHAHAFLLLIGGSAGIIPSSVFGTLPGELRAPSCCESLMIELVTYDFHNTIAHCDDWFQLEIRTLPVRVLEFEAPDELERVGEEPITEAYREMRMAVITSGVEIEAIDGLERVFRRFEIDVPIDRLQTRVAALMRNAAAQCTAVPNALESIRFLHSHGIRVGVISSAIYHPFLQWAIEDFGLHREVDFVVTSASAGIYKSDPELYRQVLKVAGVAPENAVHIGDSAKWDVWSPQQAGMRAIFVPNGEPLSALQHDTDAEPDMIASDSMEAAEWIVSLNDAEAAGELPHLIVDIFTLFPGMFEGVLGESILKRAHQKGLIDIRVHDIRNWTYDKHRTADDTPYGGGAGMVMKAPPIIEAVEDVLGDDLAGAHVAIMSAGGRRFTQAIAQELSERRRVALICGHYEGIDERVSEILNADELSIGDYVLTGGELPAMVIADTISRLVPGVITEASILDESHLGDNVEYPHYTRPQEYRGLTVPDVLLSGHHAKIEEWRADQARERTRRWRPDLIADEQH